MEGLQERVKERLKSIVSCSRNKMYSVGGHVAVFKKGCFLENRRSQQMRQADSLPLISLSNTRYRLGES
jgi:hypothetical protein